MFIYTNKNTKYIIWYLTIIKNSLIFHFCIFILFIHILKNNLEKISLNQSIYNKLNLFYIFSLFKFFIMICKSVN